MFRERFAEVSFIGLKLLEYAHVFKDIFLSWGNCDFMLFSNKFPQISVVIFLRKTKSILLQQI